jgi:hypothetical protein
MLLSAMLVAVAQGRGLLHPLEVFTALAVGDPALHRVTLGSVLPGLLAHQAGPTVLWSRAFGLITGLTKRRLTLTRAVLLGVATGALALLVDSYLLMPASSVS